MTKQRDWPNNAAWARDDAIAEGTLAMREIVKVIRRNNVSREELLQALANLTIRLHHILETLSKVQK
jgi:hypothetical protein